MKKVVLLGDSIRQIGYGTVMKDYLPNDVELWQPEDNCRFSSYTLRMIFEYKDQINGADVIHWNNGLWDVCDIFGDKVSNFTPLNVYVDTMSRIADLLLKMGKVVIFSTTTPVRSDNPYNKNSEIERYNKAVVDVLKTKGVVINDLYPVIAQDIIANIRDDDKIHLTENGIKIAVENVSKIIKKYL